MRRVVDSEAERQQILKELHNKSGQRGKEGTYRRIADRYWWSNLYEGVKDHIKTCELC
jgi:hypothetical protein